MNLTNKKFYPWCVVFLSAAFLFYKYLLQVSPSVMTTQLMLNFHVNAEGLGNLAASYFYSYLFAQLFAGPLLDKYNPRVLTSFAMLLCGLGIGLFAVSHSLLGGMLSRACVGIGAAFATVSYLKMASVWFKPNQFAFVSGLLATAAMAGSMAAQVPMTLLVQHANWREALLICAALGLVLATLFYSFVRMPKNVNPDETKSVLNSKDFFSVLKLKHNWFLMLYGGLAFSPLAVFGGLWGDAFLESVHGFSATIAASLTTAMFLGLAAGAPVFALLANKFRSRYMMMQVGVWLSLFSLTGVLYLPNLSVEVGAALLFLFGFSVGAYMLNFTLGKELNNLALAATVIAFLNTGDAILSGFAEPFVGRVLDLFWDGSVVNGVHHFNVHAYHVAFCVLPIFLVLASVSLLGLKDAEKKVLRTE